MSDEAAAQQAWEKDFTHLAQQFIDVVNEDTRVGDIKKLIRYWKKRARLPITLDDFFVKIPTQRQLHSEGIVNAFKEHAKLEAAAIEAFHTATGYPQISLGKSAIIPNESLVKTHLPPYELQIGITKKIRQKTKEEISRDIDFAERCGIPYEETNKVTNWDLELNLVSQMNNNTKKYIGCCGRYERSDYFWSLSKYWKLMLAASTPYTTVNQALIMNEARIKAHGDLISVPNMGMAIIGLEMRSDAARKLAELIAHGFPHIDNAFPKIIARVHNLG